MNSLITACFTLIGGVVLLVASQIITRFVADPLVEFRRLLSEIAYTLSFYANILHNADTMESAPEFRDAREQCRKLGSRLPAVAGAVFGYSVLARCKVVPPPKNVNDAAGGLIGLPP